MESTLISLRVYGDRFIRYPGIFEVVAGILAGVAWTVQSYFSIVDLPDRPGFSVVTYFIPWFWEWAGVMLALAHLGGLLTKDRTKRVPRRANACLASLLFWCFIAYGAALSAAIRDQPVPMLIIPAFILGSIHLVLMVRLRKGVE